MALSIKKASELRLRVISAFVLAILALFSVWAGGIVFALFISAVAFLVFLEWTAITGLTAFGTERVRVAVSMILVMAVLVLLGPRFALFALVLFFTLAYFVTASTTRATAVWTAFATLYCGLAAISIVSLREGEHGIASILLLFAIVWSSDIGAYFVGRKFGGPKLAPKISPGKTQSGAFGGFIAAIVCAAIVALLSGTFSVGPVVLVAGLISIVAQFGDLFESYLKRRFGVKDSGSIIPGHGGMFDRVDGLMPASIALFMAMNFL